MDGAQIDFVARYDAFMAQARAGGSRAADAARHAGALAAGQDLGRAEAAYRLAAELDPLDAQPRLALARVTAARGDYDAARRLAAAIFSDALDLADRSVAAFLLAEIALARDDEREARDAFEAARRLAERVRAADPNDPAAAQDLAAAHQRIAELDLAAGEREAAREGHAAAAALLAPLGDAAAQADQAFSLARLADLAFAARDMAGARAYAARAARLYEALERQMPGDRGLAAARATLARLGDAINGGAAAPRSAKAVGPISLAAAQSALQRGDVEGARAAYVELVRGADHALGADPHNVAKMAALAAAWNGLADVASAAKRPAAAQHALARVAALARMAMEHAPDAAAQRNLAGALLRLGEASSAVGDHANARAALEESCTLRQSIADAARRTPETLRDVAIVLERLGLAAQAAGDTEAACAHWEDELALAQHIFPAATAEGLRFRAIVCAHLSTLKTLHAAAYRHDALARLAELELLGGLTARDQRLRTLLRGA
jgi:tetratricopeptide (TPR) repeat protein